MITKYLMEHVHLNLFRFWCINIKLTSGSVVPWSYGSYIYNYLCNWCLSPLMVRVRLML